MILPAGPNDVNPPKNWQLLVAGLVHGAVIVVTAYFAINATWHVWG
jgi:hypothetical protein